MEVPKRNHRNCSLLTEREKKGYIQVKVAQPNVWKQKQVYLYEKEHNIIVQKGKEVVIFLDGNNRNFDIDNLYLLERKYLSQLNNMRSEESGREDVLEMIELLKVKEKMLDLAEKVNLASTIKDGKYTYRRLKSNANAHVREWAKKNPERRKEITARYRTKQRKHLERLKVCNPERYEQLKEKRRAYINPYMKEYNKKRREELKKDPVAYEMYKAKRRVEDHERRIRLGRSLKYEK